MKYNSKFKTIKSVAYVDSVCQIIKSKTDVPSGSPNNKRFSRVDEIKNGSILSLSEQKYWNMSNRCKKYTMNNALNVLALDELREYNGSRYDLLKNLVSLLLSYAEKYGDNVCVSQGRLSDELGCTRGWVNELIGRIATMGIFSKLNRGIMTCVYTINPLLRTEESIKRYKCIFPTIVWLTLSLLTSSYSSDREKVYTNKNIEVLNYNYSTSSSGFEMKKERYITPHERHRRKCEETQRKNKELLNNLLKRGEIDTETTQSSVSEHVKPRRIPTIKDIPKHKLDIIRTKPKAKQQDIIDRVLQGIMLLWEHEDAKNT